MVVRTLLVAIIKEKGIRMDIDITVIHVEDEAPIRKALVRVVTPSRPTWELASFDGANAIVVIETIKEAVRRGRQIIYVSDRNIGGAFLTGDAFWRTVWRDLTPEEREAIILFVAFCSPDGFERLVAGVSSVEGFAAKVVTAAKPCTTQELLTVLLA